MSGYAKFFRKMCRHHVFAGDSARLGAWTWLVLNAAWKDTTHSINGRSVVIKRGQVAVSLRTLADEWGWSKSSVERFMTRLKTETMIKTEAGHGKLVVTICNYDEYQASESDERDSSGTPSGTAAGQQRDTKEEVKKVKKKRTTPQPPKGAIDFSLPDWVPVDAWDGFLLMRQSIKKPVEPTSYPLVVKTLGRLKDAGSQPRDVLEQSVMNKWQGLFEVKEVKANASYVPTC